MNIRLALIQPSRQVEICLFPEHGTFVAPYDQVADARSHQLVITRRRIMSDDPVDNSSPREREYTKRRRTVPARESIRSD
jgi:hypothetical protein